MEKLFLKSVLMLLTFSVISCGGDAPPAEAGLSTFVYISGSFSEQSGSNLAGTGIVRFTSALSSINSNSSLELSGEIPTNGGSITAIFHSDNTALPLNRGVVVQFLRNGNGTLSGSISINGSSVGIRDSRLNSLMPGSFSVILEVHNTPSGSRVLVWSKDSVQYDPTNAEVDTNRGTNDLSGAYPANSGGTGVYAGLQIVNSRVTAAILGDPKVSTF